MRVSFLNKSESPELQDKINGAVKKVIESKSYLRSQEVEDFEKEFAQYCGARYCIAVSSGTAALHLLLLANNIGRGDEIITQSNGFFSTLEAAEYTGAKTIFVDIKEDTFLLDVDKVEKAITSKTKAIVPVHMYGMVANIPQLENISEEYNIPVLYDACQAHGAEFKGRSISRFGSAVFYSFRPEKILGGPGEGGAIVTDNKDIYNRIRSLRSHGQREKYKHYEIGYSYRMNEVEAAVLRVKLPVLDDHIRTRRANAALYTELLGGMSPDVELPKEIGGTTSSFYAYTFLCNRRDELLEYLQGNGIDARVLYPSPIHLQPAAKALGYEEGILPVSEKYSTKILSLPTHPGLDKNTVEEITGLIRSFYK